MARRKVVLQAMRSASTRVAISASAWGYDEAKRDLELKIYGEGFTAGHKEGIAQDETLEALLDLLPLLVPTLDNMVSDSKSFLTSGMRRLQSIMPKLVRLADGKKRADIRDLIEDVESMELNDLTPAEVDKLSGYAQAQYWKGKYQALGAKSAMSTSSSESHKKFVAPAVTNQALFEKATAGLGPKAYQLEQEAKKAQQAVRAGGMLKSGLTKALNQGLASFRSNIDKPLYVSLMHNVDLHY